MTDEEIAVLARVSEKLPGAVRVAMELRYDEEQPEAWQKLLELGITGPDLWLLYVACDRSAGVVLTLLDTGTALQKLQAIAESRFYVKPEEE